MRGPGLLVACLYDAASKLLRTRSFSSDLCMILNPVGLLPFTLLTDGSDSIFGLLRCVACRLQLAFLSFFLIWLEKPKLTLCDHRKTYSLRSIIYVADLNVSIHKICLDTLISFAAQSVAFNKLFFFLIWLEQPKLTLCDHRKTYSLRSIIHVADLDVSIHKICLDTSKFATWIMERRE
jgi:hypothetical protein